MTYALRFRGVRFTGNNPRAASAGLNAAPWGVVRYMPSGRTVAPHVLVSGKAETFNVVASAAANDGQTPEIITFNTREEAEEY